MENQHVYVLIRTKLQFYSPYFSKQKYGYFCEALKSALSQSFKNMTIIILQDCWWLSYSKPRKKPLPKFCKKVVTNLNNTQERHSSNVLFYSANSHGAAHALYNIRQIALNLSQNPNDIVIMLDDDDLLTSRKSVEDIVSQMNNKNAQMCITGFKHIGQIELDIVNRGGRIHNKLVEELSNGEKTSFGDGAICFADSLGWTKSYRVSVLREYYDDLVEYLGSTQKMTDFFEKNDAFEDFPEIINTCRKGVNVTALNKPTHSYRKHKKSITAKTKKTDFLSKRPIYLALLIGLFRQIENKLKPDSDIVVARFCVIKILIIENILSKAKIKRYRYIKRWYHKIDNGFFLQQLLTVFQREGVLSKFIELMPKLSKNSLENNDSYISIIEKVCSEEAHNGFVDIVSCMQEKSLNFQVKRSIKFSEIYTLLSLLVIIIGIICIFLPSKGDNKVIDDISKLLIGAVIGWVSTQFNHIKEDKEKAEKLTDMFSDAVSELQRHIIANLNVLLSIKEDSIKEGIENFSPSKVHFSNLKVSSHSFFMSDELDKYIIVDEFKQLSHLRVHIRNINNSAAAMENCIDNGNFKHLCEFIDWELARYFGYIASLMYFNENRAFCFPSLNQLKIYIKNRDILDYLAEKITTNTSLDKHIVIKNIYDYYCEDREKNRKILHSNIEN